MPPSARPPAASDGEYNDVFCPRDLRGGGERELLVAPALAVPGEPDDRFAAEDKGPRRAAGRILPRERAEARADLTGDALLTVGKDFRRIPKIAAGFCRGGAQLADAAGPEAIISTGSPTMSLNITANTCAGAQ